MTDPETYYHGTKVDLKVGDLIAPRRMLGGRSTWLWATALIVVWLLPACSSEPSEEEKTDKALSEIFERYDKRKIYSRLDVATLRSIPDVDLDLAVMDYALKELKDHYDQRSRIIAGFSPGVRALYLTWVVEGEVHNGGFNQYYYNTDGAFADDAVRAFEYFGAEKHAALMREANSVRAAEASEMARLKREGGVESFSKSYEVSKLGPLDIRFYELGEDLVKLRIAKIRQVPDQFVGD